MIRRPSKRSPDAPDDRVTEWVRPEIRALSAYHVPHPGDLIKLDAMENPYTWPQWLVERWVERVRGVSMNRYPDPAARMLKDRLRSAMGIPDDAAIMLGNGSDELIQMIDLAVAAPGRSILVPEPTFVMFRMIATVTGLDCIGVPLRDDFDLDRAGMEAALARHRPAIVYLACPNNPTGNHFDESDVRALIEGAPGLVVVDEAYAPFAERTLMHALDDYDNLLIMRTVSKMGLAGLRLGVLAGPSAWVDQIDKTRLPYNINVLTQVSADFALEHSEVFDEQAREIRAERARLSAALSALPDVEPYPSEANFVLVRVPPGRADALHDRLVDRGVLVKNLHGAGGALADCLRVTVGRPEENDAFLEAFEAAL